MSIAPQPDWLVQQEYEQPSWTLVYEDYRLYQGHPGEWSTLATREDIDGVQAYVTREKVRSLIIHAKGASSPFTALNAAQPTRFFSLARRSQHLETGEDHWKYTVFGYLLPDVRVYLTVLPTHIELSCEPRSVPFILL